MGTGLTLGAAIGAILLAILKGVFGREKPITESTVEVHGEPLGPRLSQRLRDLGSQG